MRSVEYSSEVWRAEDWGRLGQWAGAENWDRWLVRGLGAEGWGRGIVADWGRGPRQAVSLGRWLGEGAWADWGRGLEQKDRGRLGQRAGAEGLGRIWQTWTENWGRGLGQTGAGQGRELG